ncbi:DNA replication/repair protein RecF [Listeria seeligeri]|uniref:DNA replication/repair protein RecF n=1 Tax=Listeria seeligeri TaxID=1640 RepID=UPI0016273DBA|nr:DNA replication/repair protein RecF [Listeria seeligeri]MBC1532182.1 DNA replication/repair protein RecF [Listeria seeligeri]MBC1739324.1 DNA replication/repair protein RecF [Listeria seeligeri]MBC1744753.1 DNA replication/repair protein RecF [Listeria seeligeri]MBC1747595.1 DNA replication/repair protein RecF [Listeria seeligeri]MBC1820098.1 DNA replication/repair protein RecF [Listeria seeligeri]
MHLESIVLRNFRNYENLELEFSPSVNVFLGENAQGKTNLLEAVLMLALAKSHRTTNDKDFIMWEKEEAKMEGRIEKRGQTVPLELTITQKGKRAKVNHLEQKKLSQYVGNLNVVIFAPEDLSLVKGAPGIRRRFLNMEIGQMQPIYLHNLSEYQRILQQRNHYLKMLQMKRKVDPLLLDILTEQFADVAINLTKRRADFIQKLEAYAAPIHNQISRGLETLKIEYKASVTLTGDDPEVWKADLLQKMESIKQREIDRGVTLVGPHRDDSLFYINGQNVQDFGSQGQQRTTALSVKLAEIDLIHEETGEYPVLLLDDVLSELDDYRQSHLLGTIEGKVQTFVTTTSTSGIDHNTLKQATTFYVEKGTVKKS